RHPGRLRPLAERAAGPEHPATAAARRRAGSAGRGPRAADRGGAGHQQGPGDRQAEGGAAPAGAPPAAAGRGSAGAADRRGAESAGAPALPGLRRGRLGHAGAQAGHGRLGGAAAGGLAGNQFGKGKGNIAMTALGVVGGAFAGREVEKQVTADTAYQVTVNMDSGGQRVVTVANGEGLAPGTKVHVDGNSLLPY